MAEGASIQAVIQEPDGSIKPLIWIYDYKPKFDRAYYFEKPVTLPAGAKIDVYPANGGTLSAAGEEVDAQRHLRNLRRSPRITRSLNEPKG